jgi:hypothetical protein
MACFTRCIAKICHILGEVELVFAIWTIPLCAVFLLHKRHASLAKYIFHDVSFVEPLFIFAIMVVASTKPIIDIAERILGRIANIGGGTPKAWWVSIFLFAPCLGSLITEPASMTIAAMLLSKKFYSLRPSPRFSYATAGLLFVCISVGGSLTHFAAPPILMIAHRWQWTLKHAFLHLGLRAVVGIFFAIQLYSFIFRKEFRELQIRASEKENSKIDEQTISKAAPLWISISHIFFIVWLVANLHDPSLILLGSLVFVFFARLTSVHQSKLRLREASMVAIFLGGLVIHGGLQQWWIEPLFCGLGRASLFSISALLSSFNDNAAVTYLATLVPEFFRDATSQHAVVAGAICSGGLTVIANAPNPAGQSLLKKHFPSGILPFRLLVSAAIPTAIMAVCFLL